MGHSVLSYSSNVAKLFWAPIEIKGNSTKEQNIFHRMTAKGQSLERERKKKKKNREREKGGKMEIQGIHFSFVLFNKRNSLAAENDTLKYVCIVAFKNTIR